MRCASCQSDNREGAKFCIECGEPFGERCPKCGDDVLPEAKFCGNCGTSLKAAPPAAKPAGTKTMAAFKPTTANGERRHLTVLFCDLVNSTEIAAHLDPEQWHEIAAEYQRTAAEAAKRMGGFVAKFLGDGLVVYFGYPEAQEDAAARAVRAGLTIIEAMLALNARFAQQHSIKLSVRVGIDTGSVVVAQGGGPDADMFGEAPNIASRVQAAAAPDTVVMTAAVHDLVSGEFVVEDRGSHILKGIEQPVQLYRAIRAGLAGARSFSTREPSPFVGRDDEISLLLSRWHRVREGEGQLMLMMGEPGIGKTRLMQEFRRRIKPDTHLWIECAGTPFFASTPFHAVTQMLDQGLGTRGDETPEERAARLEEILAPTGMYLDEAVPLIAEMLNLPISAKYPPLAFAPDQKRKRLLAALTKWVFAPRSLPLVIVMEDLQWIDPSTLELLHTLVEQGETEPVMLLCTARPEFRAPWPMRAHHAQITLNRLNTRHTRELVTGVISRAGVTRDVIDAVIERTDGVPLFAEELTRLLIDGDGRSGLQGIPATLLDSLAARLDRLGPAKEVAQLGAVLGREFTYELLCAIASMPEDRLQAHLAKLADVELIYVRGLPPDASYQFKHALIQDAAYEALLKTRRCELHGRVAKTIIERFPALAEAQPQTLARHFAAGGEIDLAVAAWMKVAVSASARHAFKEAEEGYRQALAMLGQLPESPQRDARELEISGEFVGALRVTKGVGSPEAISALARCHTLAEKAGNLAQLFPALFGSWRGCWVAGNYPDASVLSGQLLDLAGRLERDGDKAARSGITMAHFSQVMTRFYCGDLLGAEEHFRIWERIWEAGDEDQRVTALSHAAIAARHLGHPDLARRRSAEANAYARDRNNPYEIATAKFFECLLWAFFRDVDRVEAAASEALAIADEQSFQQLGGLARPEMGWVRAQRGEIKEGIAQIREGIAMLGEIGSRVGMPHFQTLLGDALALDGAIDEAMASYEFALISNPEERIYRSLTLTCRGVTQMKLGKIGAAEKDFRDAIADAQSMQAKAEELRAATCLAALLKARGETDAARDLLAPVHSWFSEGADTRDLQEAKALLDTLR